MSLKSILRQHLPLRAVLEWRRFKARKLIAMYRQMGNPLADPERARKIELFRRESFPVEGPQPWLDRPDATIEIEQRVAAGKISREDAAHCRRWSEEGFLHLEGFFEPAKVEAIWHAVDDAVRSGRVPVSADQMTEGGQYEGRFHNLHELVPELHQVLFEPRLVRLAGLLLGQEAHPFQTIAFYLGSEQAAHSDSIHMTTWPEGYLVGAWLAAEDIHADSGPLIYYPGSHRLPYYLSREVGIEPRESVLDFYSAYRTRYEPFIQDVIRREGLEPRIFTPKKGDLLLWHANLLHGGSPRLSATRSRKSIVCHYFAQGVWRFHDLSASLAR